jgi:predicted P-loop ATPase
MDNIPVTLFQGTNIKIKGYSTLEKVLKKAQSNEMEPLHTALMNAKRSGKAEYSKMKESDCPGFVIGKFESRNDNSCTDYFPLLGFDIDAMKMETLVSDAIVKLRDKKKFDYVRLAYTSPSREGLRIFVMCDSKVETHKEYYEAILSRLSEDLKIPTDKQLREKFKKEGFTQEEIKHKIKEMEHLDSSTSNVSRLWFYSYVPKDLFFYNEHSRVFVIEKPVATKPLQTEKTFLKTTPTPIELTQEDKLNAAKLKFSKQQQPVGRNNEVYHLACVMSEFGVDKDFALSDLSKYEESDFDFNEIKKTVESAYNSTDPKFNGNQIRSYVKRVTGNEQVKSIGTPSKISDSVEPGQAMGEHSEEDFKEEKDKNKFQKIKSYLSSRYEFRRNVVANDIEVKTVKSNSEWQVLNENDLYCELMEFGINAVETTTNALIRSRFVKNYDPILDYFESLPEWNKDDFDYIDHLASFVKVIDREWFNKQFKKMLVRTIAQAINKIPFNKHCFTLKSGQNDGKTTFLRFLCPPDLVPYWSENFEPDSKDGRLALCQNFMILNDDIDKKPRKDLQSLKAFFTMDTVKERLPYERKPISIKRRASFVATTNEDEFLTDETGNVRWLIFEIEGIIHDGGGEKGYNKNVDINKVWSQAYSLFKSKFEFILTKDEIAKSEENNRNFQVVTAEQNLIIKYFEAAQKDEEEAKFFTATDIAEALKDKVKTQLYDRNIGRALQILKIPRVNKYDKSSGFTVKGYLLKWKIHNNSNL